MENVNKKQSFKFLFKTELLDHFIKICILAAAILLFLFHYHIYRYPGISEETTNNFLACILCIIIDCFILIGSIIILGLIYMLSYFIVDLYDYFIFCKRLLYLPLSKEEMNKNDIFSIKDYLNYLIELSTFEYLNGFYSSKFYYNEDYKILIFNSIIESFSAEEINNIDEETMPEYTKLFDKTFRYYSKNEFLDYNKKNK